MECACSSQPIDDPAIQTLAYGIRQGAFGGSACYRPDLRVGRERPQAAADECLLSRRLRIRGETSPEIRSAVGNSSYANRCDRGLYCTAANDLLEAQ